MARYGPPNGYARNGPSAMVTRALRMRLPQAAIVLPYTAMRAQGEILHSAPRQELPFLHPPAHLCRHQEVARSGNRHGSFATCLNPACGMKMVFDQETGAWRERLLPSHSQLPHPSQGPVLAPTPKAKPAPRRGYGTLNATGAGSKSRATPHRPRPEEFDLTSEMTYQSDEVDETFQVLDESLDPI